MPGYEWSSAILIRPIGRSRPQLWIPRVAWAQAIRRCLTKDACPHHLQAALFCPFCPLYLNLVHIGPNFSKKGNKTDRTGIGSLSDRRNPHLNKRQKEGKQDRKGKKTQKEADDKMKEQKRGEQNQYKYSLRSGRFRVEDTQPD